MSRQGDSQVDEQFQVTDQDAEQEDCLRCDPVASGGPSPVRAVATEPGPQHPWRPSLHGPITRPAAGVRPGGPRGYGSDEVTVGVGALDPATI